MYKKLNRGLMPADTCRSTFAGLDISLHYICRRFICLLGHLPAIHLPAGKCISLYQPYLLYNLIFDTVYVLSIREITVNETCINQLK